MKSNSAKSSGRQKLVNALLTAVRGPMFLFGVSLVLLMAIPASQATLLKGYISSQATAQPAENTAGSAVPGLIEEQASKDAAPGAAYAAPASPSESAMQRRAATLSRLIGNNSFPPSFAGTWKVLTVVTDSAVPSVPIGQRVQSEVWFVPLSNGKVVARWAQPGWTEASENVMPVSEREAELERTNYFTDTSSGGWAAFSRDHYLKVSADRMTASSEVDQYADGQYVGTYATRSLLYKVDTSVAIKP